MAAEWPTYAQVVADGYTVRPDPDVERTTCDDGMIRQVRRHTAALTVTRVTVHLADDRRYADFMAWARSHAHTWFAWRDHGGTLRQVRVREGLGGIAWTAHVVAQQRHWTADLEGWRS